MRQPKIPYLLMVRVFSFLFVIFPGLSLANPAPETVELVVKAQCLDLDGDDPGYANVTVQRAWVEVVGGSPGAMGALDRLNRNGYLPADEYRQSLPYNTTLGDTFTGQNLDGSDSRLPFLERAMFILETSYSIATDGDRGGGGRKDRPSSSWLYEVVCVNNRSIVEVGRITVEIPSGSLSLVFTDATENQIQLLDMLARSSASVPTTVVVHRSPCAYIEKSLCKIPVKPRSFIDGQPVLYHVAKDKYGKDITIACDALIPVDIRRCEETPGNSEGAAEQLAGGGIFFD